MRKKSKKDPIVPKNALSFFEHSKETGFRGLLGFKNLVELLKNESKKIKGELETEKSLEQLRSSCNSSFDKKLQPVIVEDIASCYGYYFYYFLNSDQSPLSVEESKAVCFYRVLLNVAKVAEQLEIDHNVCRKHLKKGVQILLLESTFHNFTNWVEDFTSEESSSEGIPAIAKVPIANLKQYLPKSLVFTLSTKGDTLLEVLQKYSLKELTKLKGMGGAKAQLLKDFINHNDLKELVCE